MSDIPAPVLISDRSSWLAGANRAEHHTSMPVSGLEDSTTLKPDRQQACVHCKTFPVSQMVIPHPNLLTAQLCLLQHRWRPRKVPGDQRGLRCPQKRGKEANLRSGEHQLIRTRSPVHVRDLIPGSLTAQACAAVLSSYMPGDTGRSQQPDTALGSHTVNHDTTARGGARSGPGFRE